MEGMMAYTDMPLKLPFYFSLILAVVALVVLIFGAFTCAAVFFVGAVILLSLGILGSYVGKIHTQVKNRPIYIAKEILSYDKHD